MAFIGFSQVGLKTVAMKNGEGSRVQREYTETAKKPWILYIIKLWKTYTPKSKIQSRNAALYVQNVT